MKHECQRELIEPCSMWPLLVRDGQALQYVVVTLLWNYVIGYSPVAVQSPALRYAGYVSPILPLLSEPYSPSMTGRLQLDGTHSYPRHVSEILPCAIEVSGPLHRAQYARLFQRFPRSVVLGCQTAGGGRVGDRRTKWEESGVMMHRILICSAMVSDDPVNMVTL